jgi:hypothetical protein
MHRLLLREIVMRARQSLQRAVVGVLVTFMTWASAHAQTASPFVFTPNPDGFTFTLPGVDSAGAVVDALTGGASASALVTQSLVGNTVTLPSYATSVGFEGSGNNDQGIVGVNQEAGLLNNQANVRAIAVALNGQQVQILNLDVVQVSKDNTVTIPGSNHEDHITDSFTGTSGVVGINQSAGSLNQEANVLVVGIGATLGSNVTVMGDSTLSSESSNNTVTTNGTGTRTDTISNSFANFNGIAQVTQSSGDLNMISNRIAISVTSQVGP